MLFHLCGGMKCILLPDTIAVRVCCILYRHAAFKKQIPFFHKS